METATNNNNDNNKTSKTSIGDDINNNTNDNVKFSILHDEDDEDGCSNKMNIDDETNQNNSDFNGDDIKEFVNKGRTGRRNAVADFNLDPNINSMSASKLADLMCKSMITNSATSDQQQQQQQQQQTSTN